MRRAAIVVAAFLISFVLSASAAHAHFVYERSEVWKDGGECLILRSEISHGGGGGYSKATAETFTNFSWWNCFIAWDRGPGYIALRYDLMKWTEQGWAICRQTGWHYNRSTTNKYQIYTDHGSYAPCGTGYYGTMSYGYVDKNGQWYGGHMWSGYHDPAFSGK
jgi:hypothetical protein